MGRGSQSLECEGRLWAHDMETHTELEGRPGIRPDLDPRGSRDSPKVFVVLLGAWCFTPPGPDIF